MNFSQRILNWYHFHGRKNLPWKKKKNVYHIWLSEIMLQQTTVKTVIPFFKKFIKKFQTLQKLSQASLNEILYLWSGLGYYRRAHFVYQTINIIFKKYNGCFPKDILLLQKLPGIGKSTASAILSFTYNFCYAILDSNIKRILIRIYNIQKTSTIFLLEKKLWNLINNLISIHHPDKFNQAMMDLGALICTSHNPKCDLCPCQNICIFFKNKKKYILKFPKKKLKKKKVKILLLILQYKFYIFLIQQNKKKFWPNLFCFPMFFFKKENFYKKFYKKIFKKKKNLPILHIFSHMQLLLFPFYLKISNKKNIQKHKSKQKIWLNLKNPQKIGIPTPIQKILNRITYEK
ncbi:A/G-specific adenine glycosylase [Buchnera aphidicola]|uniref:A/G-specific adenine glycosylase n=1 Tax=Buchnera aphidicola TaxID=9 RepID=UPI0031B6F7BE